MGDILLGLALAIAALLVLHRVREFKGRVAQGEKRSRVARDLGITRANAWAIVHGKSWTHV